MLIRGRFFHPGFQRKRSTLRGIEVSKEALRWIFSYDFIPLVFSADILFIQDKLNIAAAIRKLDELPFLNFQFFRVFACHDDDRERAPIAGEFFCLAVLDDTAVDGYLRCTSVSIVFYSINTCRNPENDERRSYIGSLIESYFFTIFTNLIAGQDDPAGSFILFLRDGGFSFSRNRRVVRFFGRSGRGFFRDNCCFFRCWGFGRCRCIRRGRSICGGWSIRTAWN